METPRTAADRSGTGTPDVHYDLISVIYHALQGAETYDRYVEDAERSGDRELARFLRDVQAENRRRAERAQELLYERLGAGYGEDRDLRYQQPPEQPSSLPDAQRPPQGADVRLPAYQDAPVRPAATEYVPAQAEVRQPVGSEGDRAAGAPDGPAGAPGGGPAGLSYDRGFAAGSEARYARRSFEEVEPELRRAYETEQPAGDPWERLREQVREGFDRARRGQEQ